MRKILAILALSLASCTTGITTSPPITTQPGEVLRMFYMTGVGGTSTSPGVPQIMAKTSARYGSAVHVIGPYDWSQYGTISAAMNATPLTIKVGVMGYSCGASTAPQAAAGAGRPVALVEGIQASLYCGNVTLTSNVAMAVETYNPDCAGTGGLGCAVYTPGPGFNPSNLTLVQRPDCHLCSDTDPNAQADMVDAVGVALARSSASAKVRAFGARIPGAVNVIVRHSGQRLYSH